MNTLEIVTKYITARPCEVAISYCMAIPDPLAAISTALESCHDNPVDPSTREPWGWHFLRYAVMCLCTPGNDVYYLHALKDSTSRQNCVERCADYLRTWLADKNLT